MKRLIKMEKKHCTSYTVHMFIAFISCLILKKNTFGQLGKNNETGKPVFFAIDN